MYGYTFSFFPTLVYFCYFNSLFSFYILWPLQLEFVRDSFNIQPFITRSSIGFVWRCYLFNTLESILMFCVRWCCSVIQSRPTLCNPMDCSTSGFPVHHQLPELILKLMSIELVMPSNHRVRCRPLLLLPSDIPSITVFSHESVLHIRWPKNWGFSFNISPFNEYSELVSFRMDWLDLLAVQGTLKSLFQHHSSKASVLPCSAFFGA